jgi:DNA polymerase-3 subunit delta'
MIRLSDIFGQEAAVEALRHALQADRLPHGLLFAGPAGVGKGTTAHALAAAFLCEKPKSGDACGSCESCRLIESDTHPDLHRIYRQLIRLEKSDAKARDLAIDVIRTHLVAPAGLRAAMGRGKVFIIEEAELMNTSAQNSMLKVLEEPEGRTLIILLTTQPGSLLQTIRSRCQTILFASLPEQIVQRELAKRNIDKSQAAAAARLAGGSLGLAIRWIEDGVIVFAEALEQKIDDLLAGRGSGDFAEWMKKAAEDYAEKQLARDELASKDQATREGLALYVQLAGEHIRRRLRDEADPDAQTRLCDAIDALARADQYLDANVSIPIALADLAASLEQMGGVRA